MVQAVTADGVTHDFPDGTPDSVIDAAIKNYVSTKTYSVGPDGSLTQRTDPDSHGFTGMPTAFPDLQKTIGYTGNRFIDGLIDSARQGGVEGKMFADSAQTGQSDPTVNAALSAPRVSPPVAPNDVARYAGAVSGAFGNNPVLGTMMPGVTVVGALGGEGASDANKTLPTNYQLPDWAARAGGETIATLGYGFGKNLATGPSGDAVINHGNDVISRIKAGEGRWGAYQLQAEKTADELNQASANMPQIPLDHVLDVSNTKALLDSPAGQFIPNTDGLRKIIADNKGSMFFGDLDNLKDAAGAQGNSALYNALKADQRAAIIDLHGEGASAAFDKANAARQALWLLNKSQNPSGLYDPNMLTRKMAVGPGGQNVANATPAMSALTDQASDLYNANSPVVRANTPGPSILRRAVPAAIGAGAEFAGLPGAAEATLPWVLGHGRGNVNPLYQLPGQGFNLSPVVPTLGATLLNQQGGLLGPPNQTGGGLLGR